MENIFNKYNIPFIRNKFNNSITIQYFELLKLEDEDKKQINKKDSLLFSVDNIFYFTLFN